MTDDADELSTDTTGTPMGNRGLYGRVLDTVGQQICDGVLAPGSALTIDDLERGHSISRSVAREAVRVLESMGLVTSRRRVGVIVRSVEDWNVFDPQVIRWRLAGVNRPSQLRSLTELRRAAEPEAARLAAQYASLDAASDLVSLSSRLWAAGQAGDLDRFLQLDVAFHNLILENSGNEMFARMRWIIEEVLVGRTHYGLMPDHPHVEALQLHIDVATAIQHGEVDEAGRAMRRILDRAFDEMEVVWASEPRRTNPSTVAT